MTSKTFVSGTTIDSAWLNDVNDSTYTADTAPVGSFRASLESSSGSSLVGYLPAGTGAVATDVRSKLRERVSVQDRGGSDAGVISNDTPIENALSDSHVVVVPATGTSYAGAAFTVPANKTLQGESDIGPAMSSVITVASGSRVKNLRLVGNVNPIGHLASSVDGVKLENLNISGTGKGVNLTSATYYGSGIDVNNCVIDVSDYALLTGVEGLGAPAGSGKIRTTNNTITSVDRDPIEHNYPSAQAKGFITIGNFCEQTGAASASAGFGIGAAAVEQATYVGNVILDASAEAFHLEDAYKNVSVVGNSFYGRSHGVKVSPSMAGGGTRLPATFVGNTAATPNTGVGFGYYLFYTSPATVAAHSFIGNVAHNYQGGYNIGAGDAGNHAINYLGGNVADTCTTAMYGFGNINGYWTVQRGENIAKNCTYLFTAGIGNCFFDKVTSTTTPTGIAAPFSYGTKMPSRISGFAYPGASKNISAATIDMHTWFPGGRHFGRFRYACKSTGTDTWAHYSATFKFDGTTLTITDPVSRVSGLISSITPILYLGNVIVQAVCTGVATVNAQWIEFDGEYWDA